MNYQQVKDELISISRSTRLSGAAIGRAIGVSRGQISHILTGKSETTWERLSLWAPVVGFRVVHHLARAEVTPALDRLLSQVSTMSPDDIARLTRLARIMKYEGLINRTVLDHELDGWDKVMRETERHTSVGQ